MSDDANPNPPDPSQAAPAPQPGTGAPAITPEIQALIDAARADAAKQAHDAAWKQARTRYEKPANGGGQQPPAPKPEAAAPKPEDALALLRLRDDFDDATSDLSLSGGQKKFLRGLVMDKRPDDVATFVTDFVKLSGWTEKPSPAPAAQVAAPPPAGPPAPSVTSRGSPPPPSVPGDDVPILSMSIPDRTALLNTLVAKHGWVEGNKQFADRNDREMKTRNMRARPF